MRTNWRSAIWNRPVLLVFFNFLISQKKLKNLLRGILQLIDLSALRDVKALTERSIDKWRRFQMAPSKLETDCRVECVDSAVGFFYPLIGKR